MKKIAINFSIIILLLTNVVQESEVLAETPSLELVSNIFEAASDVAVSGNYAYVTTSGKLVILDISNPSTPAIIGELSVPDCSFIAVDVEQGLSYVTQAYYYCRPQASLYIVDVTNPENPIEIGKAEIGALGAGTEVDVEENFAYITHAQGGFIIVDVSDSQNPTHITTFASGVDFRDVKVVENLAYLADISGYLWIVDVSDPENPVTLSTFNPGPGNALGVDVLGSYAYVALGSQGLRIIDVSSPTNPTEVGYYDDPIPNTGYSVDVEVEGNYAFVADSDFSLKVIDVSDKTNPYLVDQADTEELDVRLTTSGNYIYVATVTGGLYIFRFGEESEIPTPFLDLPWNYEGKGMTFNEAATAIGSYFDHEYPFVDVGSILSEPPEAQGSLTSFDGKFRDKRLPYSSHDGYDWLGPAEVHNGDPVLAAASGVAQYFKADKDNPVCGTTACGNVIVINHENGYQTRYYHLQDNDPISQSFTTPRHVNQGEVIGKVGSTGKSSAPHIHFSVIQDKNNDGNFDDNRPEGMTDPFGWNGDEPDPWPNYNFSFNDEARTGNESHYLWLKSLYHFSGLLPLDENIQFEVGRYTFDFPAGVTGEDLTIEANAAPIVSPSNILRSIGSTVVIIARNAAGEAVSSLAGNFILTVDFSGFDLIGYKQETMAIYTTEDGVNWTRVDTDIDFINKTASSQLDHFSQFALMAERVDTTPPITTAKLPGTEGQESWFGSDVEVALNAQDNEGGSGIYYIGYKVDDGYFSEYAEPFIVSEEGEHTIEFYSVDNDENIEDVKSVSFHIDKAPPEAKLQFGPDKLDTEILGVDETEVEVTFSQSSGRFKSDLITLKDKAGNTLRLQGKFRRTVKADTFSIEAMQYNSGEPFKFNKNLFSTAFSLDKKSHKLNRLIQSWFDKGETLLSIIYDAKKDKSTIYHKKPGEKLKKETKPGIVLLYLKTNNGNLEYGYE